MTELTMRRHRIGAVLAAGAGALLVLMNFTAPMITVPWIAADLDTDVRGQTWMLTAAGLGLAATLLLAGGLADHLGRTRVFTAGAGLLAVAVGGSAGAWDSASFVLTRLLAGVGSAVVLAAGLGLVSQAYPAGPARLRATGLWAAMIGAGACAGPLLAAGLAGAGGWRAGYWVIAGAAVILTAAGSLMPAGPGTRRRLDLPGVVALGAGLALLVAAMTEGRSGLSRGAVLPLGLAGLAILAGFVVVEVRSPSPLLAPALFRRVPFLVSTGGALVVGVSVIGLVGYLPTLLQRGLDQTALATAAVLGAWSGTSLLTALPARRLAARWSPHRQVAAGLVLCGGGDLAMYGFLAAGSTVRLIPGLVLAGAGLGVLNAVLARLAVDSVPADQAAMGAGASNTARFFGASLGTALVVAVAAGPGGGDATSRGTNAALLICGGLALLGAVAAGLARDPAACHPSLPTVPTNP